VTAVNATLANDTGAVNKDAEGAAWFVKLALDDAKEADALMDAAAYKKLCDAEKH
jgi:glycine cleavage system H lipoate-binding protein